MCHAFQDKINFEGDADRREKCEKQFTVSGKKKSNPCDQCTSVGGKYDGTIKDDTKGDSKDDSKGSQSKTPPDNTPPRPDKPVDTNQAFCEKTCLPVCHFNKKSKEILFSKEGKSDDKVLGDECFKKCEFKQKAKGDVDCEFVAALPVQKTQETTNHDQSSHDDESSVLFHDDRSL